MTKPRDNAQLKVYAFFFVAFYFIASGLVVAAEPGELINTSGRHPLYHKTLPPGAVWQSPAAVSMHQAAFQPVAFSGPAGTKFSLPQGGSHAEGEPQLMGVM